MHLPYPKRKSSNAQPFLPRGSNPSRYGVGFSIPRRYRSQAFAVSTLVLIGLIWLLTRGGSQHSTRGGSAGMANHVPSGKPPAVIVTVLDEGRFGARYTDLVKENRRLYAEKHGYATFFPKVGDYNLKKAPVSWTKVVAMRHALTQFPDATYFWYVDIDTFIMNPALAIERDIMAPAKLEGKMIVDHPVVPPDSIIHTFSHLKAEDVHFVVAQDKDGLATNSWLVRNSEWSRYFLDTWFDPTYRSYNFQKAETHALVSPSIFAEERAPLNKLSQEHIVQWHPTILSNLALVPQRFINSYDKSDKGQEYTTGDLSVRFAKCAKSIKKPTCETEAEPYASVWRSAYRTQ